MQPSKRIDSASRFIPTAPSSVYAAFTDPKAMEQWMPPKGMTGSFLHFDFRKGGSYRMRLTYKNAGDAQGKTSADTDEVEVRLIDLVDCRRIEQAVAFESDDPDFSGTMRMTWKLDPEGNGTLVTILAEDVPRGIRPEDHEAGMNSTLDNLVAFLGGGPRPGG